MRVKSTRTAGSTKNVDGDKECTVFCDGPAILFLAFISVPPLMVRFVSRSMSLPLSNAHRLAVFLTRSFGWLPRCTAAESHFEQSCGRC